MAAGLPTIASQQPVDLGSGFEDPMDPCTMCQQGQMEIQQAYNDLTQTCNACQTQQNLKTLTSQGCQGCAQAQQVIQNVQNQSGGCSSCGQPTTFNQLSQQPMQQSSQPMLFMQQQPMPQGQQRSLTIGSTMPMTSQGLVQPMLTPLTGTGQQMLTTVMQQPGMIANQLPIATEMGATSQTTQNFLNQQRQLAQLATQQPMITGMLAQPSMVTQPVITGMVAAPAQPQQPQVMTNIPPPPPPPMQMQQPQQPVYIPPPAPPPPAPVMQPVQAPPPPTMQPAPVFNVPSLTPAQIAAAQQIAQAATPTIPINITGAQLGALGAGGATGYGAGGGKAGPGAGGGISIGPEGQLNYSFNIAAGPGVGNTGIGGLLGGFGPGAFDTHRPDLHAGGGWHLVMPMGTEQLYNLL